jgi:1-aminocyclopropane-1-carboxylate deaminase/D-cysteine desulfhydrase-like pyridoxal-dependent ACC family enzyme
MALFLAQYFALYNSLQPPVEVVAIPCVGDEQVLRQNIEELDRRTFQLKIYPTILSIANAPGHSFGKPSKAHYDIWNTLRTMTNGIEFDLLYAPRAFEILLSQGILQSILPTDKDYNIIYYHCGGVEGNQSQLKRYEYLRII